MSVLVWAAFKDGDGARAGVDALIESSFPPDEIRMVLKRHGDLEDVPMKRKTAVPAAAAVGATLGAAGAAGAVLLTGSGALLAAGPVAALLQASGMGAAFGGITGALGGLGWWKDEPDVPADADDEADARVLVLIPVPEGRESEAKGALEDAGAEHVSVLGAEAAAQAHVSDDLAEDAKQQPHADPARGQEADSRESADAQRAERERSPSG